jgi:hypothetical protein
MTPPLIEVVRLLRGRILAERRGDRESDRSNDCEEPNAGPGGEARGAKHKDYARVANRQLVLQRVAFDEEKSESRGPETEVHKPAAYATRW